MNMELLTFDVELAQTISTKDNGTFTIRTVAEESDERNQSIFLADGRHIVTTQGFRVEELDEKIKEIQNAAR